MLKFKYLEVKNFMSVGNEWLRFEYTTGLSYVYGENHDVSEEDDLNVISNGTGKTVILVDAPLFALYGRTQRKIKRSDIVNIQNGCDCEVRLCFDKDEDEYIIERGLKPDKIIIIKNGVAESEEAKKRQANKIIVEEILDGISFEVFKNLIVLNGTSSKHFFEYGKQEKRTFINEVFRLGFLEYLQSHLTDAVKTKKTEIEKYEIQKTSKEEEIQRLKNLVEATENGEVVDVASDLKAKISEEMKRIQNVQTKVTTIEKDVFSGDMDSYSQKRELAQQKINETNEEIIRLDSSIANLRTQYKTLKDQYLHISAQRECPQCTQPISDDLKKRLYNKLATAGTEIKTSAEEMKTKKTDLEQRIEKMRSWIDNANLIIEEYRTHTSSLQQSTVLLQEYQNQLQNKPEGGVSLDVITEEIKELERGFEDFEKEMQEAVNDYNIHKVTRDLVGGKNFYGFYISVFRKYLNKSINEYLEKIQSPHRVQFNNDLEADVFDGNLTLHSYDNLSTGEKSKINLALLISFFDVLHTFHRMETSLLVLDEILDTGIDSSGIYALHKVLKEKVDENPNLGIYVVSHKNAESTFADQEEVNKIIFERKQGFTTIKDK